MKLYHEGALTTLYQGDALDLNPLHSSEVFVIDPPYSRAGGLHTGRQNASLMAQDSADSDQFWLHWFKDVADRLCRVTARCGFVFCDYRTVHLVEAAFGRCGLGWYMSQCLVWDRDSCGMGTPFRASYEMIAFVRGPAFKWEGRRDIRNILRYRWPYGAHTNHPAEKPVALLEFLITETTAPGERVLDCFSGAGSTLVAGSRIGRRVIGVETHEEYCRKTVERLAQPSCLQSLERALEVPA